MKLIYAIINNDDSNTVSSKLTHNGFSVTKLASTGGFLMSGNTTFLICSEDEKVDEAVDIIKEYSRRRQQFMPSVASFGGESYGGVPTEVTVGGATIFVTNVERFEKA